MQDQNRIFKAIDWEPKRPMMYALRSTVSRLALGLML